MFRWRAWGASADTIYINATVITVNDAQPTAEAVAVQDGRILAVGDHLTIEQIKGKSTPDAHTWGTSRTYTNHVRLAGIKLSADGSPQGRTAWLSQPYFKPPEGQPADYRGYGGLTYQ